MSFNFPNSPAVNDSFTPVGGPTYQWDGTVWRMSGTAGALVTAQAYNRIVNPCAQFSQELGIGISSPTAGTYGLDQWVHHWTGPAASFGAGTNAALPTINGSIGYWYYAVTTAKTSLAASDILQVWQNIEGNRIADLRWGYADAKPVVIRFSSRHSIAGTFCVMLRNSALTRSWIGEYTVTASDVNKWVVKTFAVPGDTTGVWPTDNTIGVQLIFTFACGTTYHGVPGWQAGDKRGTVNSTNGGATVSNSFVVSDVGLYLDPDATGVAPKWQMPDYATELAACQRYWYKSPSGAMIISGIATAASQTVYEAINHPTTMRVSPTIAFSSYGNLNISTGMIFHAGDEVTLRVSALPAAAGPFYSSAVYTASARM